MPATGKTVEVTVMEMFRLENHRIVEQWVSVDVHGMLRQLGMA
jgi:predicted ester cyclase